MALYRSRCVTAFSCVMISYIFFFPSFLCFVDRASLYDLVNKANLVHIFFSMFISFLYMFGRLCAHRQGKQLYLCDTCYLLFYMDDSGIAVSHPYRITSTKCHINTVVSPDDGHIVAVNM